MKKKCETRQGQNFFSLSLNSTECLTATGQVTETVTPNASIGNPGETDTSPRPRS